MLKEKRFIYLIINILSGYIGRVRIDHVELLWVKSLLEGDYSGPIWTNDRYFCFLFGLNVVAFLERYRSIL